MKLALTAGYDRAKHAIALAELLTRSGHVVSPILIVSPWSMSRVRTFMKRGGYRFVFAQALRLFGRPRTRASQRESEVDVLLRSHRITDRRLTRWARRRGATVQWVWDLNQAAAVAAIRGAGVDGLVYAGGGILREVLLDAVGGRVVNAHSGPLPQVRGMNACEWSLLLGLAPTVTIHFIDRGVDTGQVISVLPVPVRKGDDVEALRERCTVLGVEGIVAGVAAIGHPPAVASAVAPRTRQCFVLAPAMRELLELRLRERRRREGV